MTTAEEQPYRDPLKRLRTIALDLEFRGANHYDRRQGSRLIELLDELESELVEETIDDAPQS